MKLKKLFPLILLLGLTVCSLFAYEGKMADSKNLKVVKTKYCEIVYPDSCSQSAAILQEKADGIYEKIAAEYGGKPFIYVIVTIVPSMDKYEGYFDGMPYNHIVLTDTAQRDDFLAYEDGIVTEFTHEVAHAYTRCIRAPFWKALGLDLGFVFYNTAFTDGAAVTAESMNGDGRLNDEYFKHVVKQAKIEDSFPRIWDKQGENPYNPTGDYIAYWGMFTDYLQKTYGMKNYNEYWYQMVNWLSITMRQGFRKAYKDQGLKLEKVWKEWVASLDYSNVETDLFKAEYGIDDFFAGNDQYSNYNRSGMLMTSLQQTEKGIYFLDSSVGLVYFVSNENFGKDNIKLVCERKNATSISASKDGKYIAVSYDSYVESNIKAKVAIYNTETKKWTEIAGTGRFANTIVEKDGKYHLVCTKYANHLYRTEISLLTVGDKGKITGCEVVSEINYVKNQLPQSYADNGDGTFALVVKTNSEFAVCVSDLSGSIRVSYKAPKQGMFIKQISSADGVAYFSWTEKDSMPRFGQVVLANGQFNLDTKDFTGGVFSPIKLNDEKVAFVGVFANNNVVLTRNVSNIDFDNHKSSNSGNLGTVAGIDFNSEGYSPFQVSEEYLKNASKKYNPVNYYGHFVGAPVVGVPISIAYSRDYIDGSDCYYWQPMGVSLFSTDPWKDGHLRLHVGYGVETNSISAHFTYFCDPDTENYKYKLKSASEVDFVRGWKLSNLGLSGSINLPFADGNTVTFSADTFTNYGKRNKKNYDLSTMFSGDGLKEMLGGAWGQVENYFLTMNVNSAIDFADTSLYLYNTDMVDVSYSFIRQLGCGKYEKAGFEIGSDLHYIYKAKTTNGWETYQDAIDMGLDMTVYFPGFAYNLVNSASMTYNAPARFIFSLFPYDVAKAIGADSSFLNTAVASINALAGEDTTSDIIFVGYGEIVLFGMDLSCAIPGIELLSVTDFKISLTIYDFIFDATKSGGYFKLAKLGDYFNGSIETKQWVYLGLRADLGLNISMGTFAGASIGKIFVEGMCNVYGDDSVFNFSMGFAMDF